MKKSFFYVLAFALVLCFASEADARLSRSSRIHKNKAVYYLNKAQRMRSYSARARYLRMAERRVNRIYVRSSRDRRYKRYAKRYINRAQKYVRKRATSRRYIRMAKSRLRSIRGTRTRSTRSSSRYKARVRRAISYLSTAHRMRTRSARARYLNRAESKLRGVRLRSSRDRNYLRYARRYINRAQKYVGNSRTAKRYIRLARTRLRRIN